MAGQHLPALAAGILAPQAAGLASCSCRLACTCNGQAAGGRPPMAGCCDAERERPTRGLAERLLAARQAPRHTGRRCVGAAHLFRPHVLSASGVLAEGRERRLCVGGEVRGAARRRARALHLVCGAGREDATRSVGHCARGEGAAASHPGVCRQHVPSTLQMRALLAWWRRALGRAAPADHAARADLGPQSAG